LNAGAELQDADVARLGLRAEQELDALARRLARDHRQDAALGLGIDRLIPSGDLAQLAAFDAHTRDAKELAGLVTHIAARVARPAAHLVEPDQLGLEPHSAATFLQPHEQRRGIVRLNRA
jgi:hypothetical protein